MKKEKLGTKQTLYSNSSISRSLSQLSLSSLLSKPTEYFFKGAKIVEKEYESIAEEASIQSIQSPIVKRDQSVDSAKILKNTKIYKNHKDTIFSLEKDLLNVRNEYLCIFEEKLKVDKELVFANCKIKTLEENKSFNEKKIAELQRKIDSFAEKEAKLLESTAKVEELTRKIAEISEKSEKDHKETLKHQVMCEEKIEQLKRNSVIYKTELSYKDEYCETLKQQIEALKSLSKDHYENKAVKNLSYIILSKDKHISTDPSIRQKETELESDSLSKKLKKTKLKCKKQKEWIKSISLLLKSRNWEEALLFIRSKDLETDKKLGVSSKISTGHSTPPVLEANDFEVSNQVLKLKKKVKSLKMKLEVSSSSKDFLSFIQCQASIIEDYLNEDSEISLINSSMFSS